MKLSNKKIKYKFRAVSLKIFIFLFTLIFLGSAVAFAAGEEDAYQRWKGAGYTPKIGVSDEGTLAGTIKGWVTSLKVWAEKKALDEAKYIKDIGFATAWRAALNNFLNKLAYDTATYLATGDKGQAPMFQTDNIGDFLKNSADSAAGDMIETLGKYGPVKFNLCNPNQGVTIRIGLGLLRSERPKEPTCTFSKMTKNWEAELKNPGFLNNFQSMFNPWENDMGIALNLWSAKEQKKAEGLALGEKIYELFQIKPVTDPISDRIKSPSVTTQTFLEEAIRNSTEAEKTWTTPGADTIGIFVNTLVGKLIDKWLKEGFVSKFADNSYDWSKLSDYFAGGGGGSRGGGIKQAKEQFAGLIEPDFNERGDYNILAELTSCPNPSKAGPTNCVITNNFSQAIADKMTVGEAMKKGYLNPNGIFGFTSDGLEPSFMEGFPYRSMVILRKFRILPVGWEVASQYIKDHPSGTAGTGGTRNLADLVSCFDQTGDEDNYDNGYNAGWCAGLVDPNWVLKAPLNYCRREGPGPEIISKQTTGAGEDSRLALSRNDNYCADEQTCIKESTDGKCELYGYCTEERRKWDFGAGECDPQYNTCQTFRARDGSTISYLENTLDYGACSAANVGCREYCEDYNFASSTFSCTVSSGNKIYLDADAAECAASDEGCHEFIRTKEGVGANLVPNASFEDLMNPWPEISGVGEIATGTGFHGANALNLSGTLNKTITSGPDGHTVAGESYSLSFYVNGCSASDSFMIEGQAEATPLASSNVWQPVATNFLYPGTASENVVVFTITAGSCLIDAIKLERGAVATAFSDYRDKGVVYQKLAPTYLACDGSSDPAECDDYIRFCSAAEVGCDLFTSLSDSMSVPAKITSDNYCPGECVGYDEYVQSKTIFEVSEPAIFIPKSAKTCSRQAAGCDEFTNLDKLGAGAEAREYYSEMQICQKPSSSSASCENFYTWEGSDETGYKLKVHSLQASGGAPTLWETGQYKDQDCNSSADYDLANNPLCREFYNTGGEITYSFLPYVITCSEDCHPYRRTIVDASGSTDCPNGGEWDSSQGACIYMAVPGEGIVCSASQAGCREYSGNAGANMRILLTESFEDGTNQDWTGVNSTESLMVGEHSLFVSGSQTEKIVGPLVNKGESYIISFKAKSGGGTAFNQVGFGLSAPTILFDVGTTGMDNEWRLYEFNLSRLDNDTDDYALSPDEKIFISANGGFYLDDIRLVEVTDRYYLIKDSWVTPSACLQDLYGNPVGETFNLGCDAYKDQENTTHFLRRFNRLCQESAIGCQIMIDTHNSSNPNAGTDAESVAADSYDYVVYDRTKACNASGKGCQRLGDPYRYGSSTVVYGDIFLKNDPDTYDNILCSSNSAGCDVYSQGGSFSYFKDPGDQLCEWRQQGTTTAAGWDWYKKPVKRCDTNGDGAVSNTDQICASEGNCAHPSGQVSCKTKADCGASSVCYNGFCHPACVTDTQYYPCTADYAVGRPKTLGTGGTGGLVKQPVRDTEGNWAGVCPATQAGCAEYIDPISRFSQNAIFNPDFSQNVDYLSSNLVPDGWSSGGQTVTLENNTLYILAVEGANTLTLTAPADTIYPLDSNSQLLSSVTTLAVTAGAGERFSQRFYTANSPSPINAQVEVADTDLGPNAFPQGSNNSVVEVTKAAVGYHIKQKTDPSTCNGIVNFGDGCVLFNERKVISGDGAGVNYNKAIYDSDLTINDTTKAPQNITPAAEWDANLLLKVSPDRTCDKWLACRSFIKNEKGNNVCFDIGLCDRADENGDCASFVYRQKVNETYGVSLSPASISDLSGYSKVGNNGNSYDADLYPLGAMDEIGEVSNVANGNFEFYGSNKYPVGWNNRDGESWSVGKFSVVNNPYAAQQDGIEYPKEGRSFLKFSPSATVMESEYIDVEPGQDYILSLYMNTIDFQPGSGFSSIVSKVSIETYDASGNATHYQAGATANNQDIAKCEGQPEPWVNGCAVTLENGHGWTKLSKGFTVGGNHGTTRIKLVVSGDVQWGGEPCCEKVSPADGDCTDEGPVGVDDFIFYPSASCRALGAVTYDATNKGCLNGGQVYNNTVQRDSCAGNAYIDDIQLRPALDTRTDKIESQTCRLYPEDDSLSCDYYNDSGIRTKGWKGYCLEYDRYPGQSDACILWYPVDKVKGEGVEEGAGYKGKAPVYYCLEAGGFTPLEYRPIPGFGDCTGFDDNSSELNCPAGYNRIMSECEAENWGYVWCQPVGQCLNDCQTVSKCEQSGVAGWYASDGVLATWVPGGNSGCGTIVGGNEAQYGIKYFNPFTANTLSDNVSYCTKIVQTVDPAGNNLYWAGRVYEGSDYRVLDIGYKYTTDGSPYGSIVTPAPISNPYEWDGDASFDGYQPLSVFKEGARSSHPYSMATPPPLGGFYGTCQSSGNLCLSIPGLSYSQNNADCPAGDVCIQKDLTGDPKEKVKRLFARSGGVWVWSAGRYTPQDGEDWGPPETLCQGTGSTRPAYDVATGLCNGGPCTDCAAGSLTCDYCAVTPSVTNIIANDRTGGNLTVSRNQVVNLTFNTKVDSQQLPLVMYAVDWGDGEETTVSGVQMRDRSNTDNPHSLYHLYSYWAAKAQDSGGTANIDCRDDCRTTYSVLGACCAVKPKVRIRDNWGWCNGGQNMNDCDYWEEYNGYIVVTEK